MRGPVRTGSAHRLGVDPLIEADAENRAWLRQLPQTIRTNLDGRSLFLFHGSPLRANEYLWSERPSRVFARIASDEADDIFAFGHTHEAFHRAVGPAHFVACGSVVMQTIMLSQLFNQRGSPHVLAVWALFGLTIVFRLVPQLYVALKLAGGVYLIWIAWKMWRHAADPLAMPSITGVRIRPGAPCFAGPSVTGSGRDRSSRRAPRSRPTSRG